MSVTGKCLCGAVSFTADSVETHVHACHCATCRKWTGGPMLAARVDNASFTGEQFIKRYASSSWAERGFCGECGSSLFYCLKESGTYIITTGAFDDVEQFDMAGEIFIDEKPGGYDFAGDHPRLTGAEFLASMGQDND